jgi:hypothetical protein
MLNIDLTNAEAAFLMELLETNLNARHSELTHTDNRQYRTYVKERIATLELVQAKFRASTAGMRVAAG